MNTCEKEIKEYNEKTTLCLLYNPASQNEPGVTIKVN